MEPKRPRKRKAETHAKPEIKDISPGQKTRDTLDALLRLHIEGIQKAIEGLADEHGLAIGALLAIDYTGVHVVSFGRDKALVGQLREACARLLQDFANDKETLAALQAEVMKLRRLQEETHGSGN